MAEPTDSASTPNDVKLTLATRINRDPVNFRKSNLFQQRFYRALKDPQRDTLTVVLALKPNRVGGSWATVTAWSAIMFGSSNRHFQGSPFGAKWPFLKSARLVSTAECLGDVGPLQVAIRKLFPVGRYSQTRGVGKPYYSAGKTVSGWEWDAMSYGQDALTAAGSTKGLVICSEPPPRDLFTECVTRLSGNGLLIVECTQLDLAPFLEEMAEDAGGKEIDGVTYGSFKLNGKSVGEVRVVRGDIEDSCREHSEGHQAHTAIEATVAAWPAEEREARRTGKPLKLSGRIYPRWGEANELEAVPDWHAKKWDEGNVRIATLLDPADQRPWAMTWFACYPNDDVIAFQEWPPFDFNECENSPIQDIEDYRDAILESESGIGRKVDKRGIDGLFGNTPGKGNANTLRDMLAAPCRECLRQANRGIYEDLDERSQVYAAAYANCKHRLSYESAPVFQGSVRDGHIIVRAAIGEPDKGKRPKLYALRESTPNFCKGMRRYAWKPKKDKEKGMIQQPQLVFKDFPDTVRMLYLLRWERWPQEAPPPPRVDVRKATRLSLTPKGLK